MGPVLICLSLLVRASLCGRFDFGLFENFEVSSDIFEHEVRLHSHLRTLRDELAKKKSCLEAIAEGRSAAEAPDLIKTQTSIRATLSAAFDATRIFPPPADYIGAVKGMLMLQDTYRLDVGHLRNGTFRDEVLKKTFRSRGGLNLHELLDLAEVAFSTGWFDSAVVFLREAVEANKTHTFRHSSELKHLETLGKLQRLVPKAHNDHLRKRQEIVGDGFKVLPYLVETDLSRRKKQPKFVKERDFSVRSAASLKDGDAKEHFFRRICRGETVGTRVREQQGLARCHWLHHDNPFLRLAPFKMEVLLQQPFRMILHGILSEEEIAWLIEYSKPRLSRRRYNKVDRLRDSERTDPRKRKIVHKTVQCWIEDQTFNKSSPQMMHEDMDAVLATPISSTVTHPVMLKLAMKFEKATQMVITGPWSSTLFQVTNYGLSGLCESHMDPYGIIEGAEPPADQPELAVTGDMLGTIMAWLDDVPAGGATAFDCPSAEQIMLPTRGSASFWISLSARGHRDMMASHGGCPILVGSKWILNKWIFYYDQFHKFKCGLNVTDVFGHFKGTY